MPIPISSSLIQLNAEAFFQEGFELSLDAIIPSIELTGSFSQFESKTQFYIYNYSKTLLYSNLNYNSNGSFLQPETGTATSTSSISTYNQFELIPSEDIYNQGYSTGKYYAVYNFIDYELGSEVVEKEKTGNFEQHPYFIKEISGDRTELRIQNNYLISQQIETSYNEFKDKLDARENVDEFYISFIGNRNFIGINSQLEIPNPGSSDPTSILIKLYAPLPLEFVEEMQLQIITKVGETQVFEVEFTPNIEYIDNLLSLKGPNYNIDIKDRVNNSTNFKTFDDLINTNSSQSYYQFNSLQDQKGVFLRKNWGDWNQFVKYSSAEQRLNNFYDKMVSIEAYEAETQELETIGGGTTASIDYSSSYNAVSNNINKIISKFDSYEYFLYYITGSQSWPKYTPTYPYTNYSVSSSAVLNWFGSTDESSIYYNSGKNQIYSASRYDNNNQDYLYYLIPPYITENSSNNQYIKFVNMTGQAFDEMYLYTEAVEQVRNTNSSLTGSVLPLGLADEVITSLGFDTYSNDFNSVGFNVNGVGIFPATGSGLEYIDRYIDIASGSVINYYDTQQSTLGYVIALADPSFPYPLENSAQEIYKRIFHNMVSLVKRKGTVTGLRQLINIWGVPNTMLRISEFGGKNKDDENDYDLWMNRYSNAMSTIPTSTSISSTTKASGSIRIPWTPLTSNYYEEAVNPDIAVPDCIQFRFKNQKPISSDSVFSQSLLLKNSIGSTVPSDFGIVLQYSGSQSGSFSGSVIPTDSQYGSMQFVISGSTSEGGLGAGYFETEPITLPFFNNDWWSVQLQRKTHISQSVQNSTLNEYELKVANNIYDGYDGNQIGFQGSASITMPDNKITSSINEAWNKFSSVNIIQAGVGTLLGGFMNLTTLSGYKSSWVGLNGTGRSMGGGFLGQFQEFRYYKRAMSGSSFNDYVMNPESIQGHADSNTGAGSSYDLLSFRLPLGNELEYNNPNGTASFTTTTENGGNIGVLTFGGRNSTVGSEALGSIHPSLVNKKGSLYTSSFLNMSNYTTQSGYVIVYQGWDGTDTSAVTSSYLSSNTEINYMDQPAAGIRNRIKNKIQVIDGNEYGTTLSPFRSIQQEFEQSSSYTEDLNSLEVGFSFQNEINDDIIATFGHGVVSDAIADPRFISESSDRYPELTRIAEDYFKKYQGYTITDPRYTGLPTVIEQEYDYNRLIKFYETSLFKAIKNYVPARTSLSTGIIVKQHLLERNKTDAVIGMHTETPLAKTPETGSNSWGYTTQTGFNSVIANKNLLITSSIAVGSLTGSAGGSVNKYNVITDEGKGAWTVNPTLLTLSTSPQTLFAKIYGAYPVPVPSANNRKVFMFEGEKGTFGAASNKNPWYMASEVAVTSQVRFKPYIASITPPPNLKLEITSSKRGGIFTTEWSSISALYWNSLISDNYITIYPDERLYASLSSNNSTSNIIAYTLSIAELGSFDKPEPSASQQVNWYIDDYTGLLKVKDTQEEFYNGEYSGSNIPVELNEYNPYRIYADGTNKNPDTTTPYTPATLDLGAGTYSTDRFPSGVTTTSATAVAVRATASLVYPSGSAVGADSSDSLLFKGISDSTTNRTIKLISTDGTTRYYVNIGASTSMNDAAAQSKLLFISYAAGDLSNYTTVSTGIVPLLSGTNVSTTLSNGSKQITANITWAGGSVGSCRVVDNNPNTDNDTNWFVVGDTFSGFPTGMGTNVDFLITAASMTNGLVGVQFMNDGTAAGTKANLKSAIESSNGHTTKINVVSTTNVSDEYLTLKQLTLGTAGNTAITYASNFADNTDGVIEASKATGASPQYLAPTTFQGGVDELASDTKYLQNAITGLTPGVTYEISFDITGYANDGLGGSSYEVGMSSIDSPGGPYNGAGSGIRGTSNGPVTGTWVQLAGTTTAMFLAHAGVYATISNVVITPPTSILAPKHFYERDSFTIMPTSSWLFQNSPYNPLLHNISGSRPNSFLFDMDFYPVGPGTTLKEGIPSDYSLLVSSSQLGWEGTATADALLDFSEVPDSNYTIPSIINPRYVGCLLESADYNFYTGIPSESLAIGKSSQQGIIGLANPPYLLKQNKVQFINGETGSWTGDTSFGKNAVIDMNPIYFAHFKSSLESKEYFGTTTFNIDQLIQVPFEEILNEQSPIITSSMINGSNENLIPMSSTFMPGREATIVYNQTNKIFNNIGGTILTYTNLGVGSNIINAGGINFIVYQTNESKLDQLSTIQYYNLPIWYSYKDGANLDTLSVKNPNIETTPNSSSLLLSGSYFGIGRNYIPYEGYSSSYFIPFSSSLNAIAGGSGDPFDIDQTFYTGAPSVIFAFTGSRKDANNRDVGVLNLRGPSPSAFPGMFYLKNTSAIDKIYSIKGPTISLFNSINNLLSLGDINPAITSSNSTDQPQTTAMGFPAVYPLIPCSKQILGTRHQSWGPGSLPVLDQEQINNPQNYFKFNLSGSNLTEYRNLEDEKIKIDIGDEIRVSYAYYVNDENVTTLNKTYQDFTVLSYDQCAPVVSTQAISKTAFDGQLNVSFSLAVNYFDSSAPPIPTFKSNLPKEGYYNFTSLLNKYKTAMYNGDIYMLSAYYGSSNTYGCSGSITGVNSNNEDNGTGIIGITMSVTTNHSNYNDGSSLDFGTNYTMQNGDDDQYNTTMKKIGMANPTVNLPSTEYFSSTGYPLDPGFLFDRVVVSPDPNSLAIPIPMGRIYAMTLRKRVEADDRVILDVNQPSGSAGTLTLSGDGYLIPDDLTNIQQRNVQKIINKLKSENVFTQDSPDSVGS